MNKTITKTYRQLIVIFDSSTWYTLLFNRYVTKQLFFPVYFLLQRKQTQSQSSQRLILRTSRTCVYLKRGQNLHAERTNLKCTNIKGFFFNLYQIVLFKETKKKLCIFGPYFFLVDSCQFIRYYLNIQTTFRLLFYQNKSLASISVHLYSLLAFTHTKCNYIKQRKTALNTYSVLNYPSQKRNLH